MCFWCPFISPCPKWHRTHRPCTDLHKDSSGCPIVLCPPLKQAQSPRERTNHWGCHLTNDSQGLVYKELSSLSSHVIALRCVSSTKSSLIDIDLQSPIVEAGFIRSSCPIHHSLKGVSLRPR